MAAESKSKNRSKSKGMEKSSAQKGLAQHPANKFLDVYKQEVENKHAEILLRKEDSQNHKEYSMHSMNVQAADRKHAREVLSKESTKQKVFFGTIIIVLVGFVSYLVVQGQDQLAEMVISLAGGAVLGAFGGYGYAMQKSAREKNRFDG